MRKVLLVEDEPFIRQGMRKMIPWEKYGFEIYADAANGIEAMELLEKEEVDLVFVDIQMPGMSGMDLIRRTRESGGRQPEFVIMSGYADFEYARRALSLNVADYILKPVQKEEVEGILERMTGRKNTSDSSAALAQGASVDLNLYVANKNSRKE